MVEKNTRFGDLESERNYWMIPMDFETYSFSDMKKELAHNKAIRWGIRAKPIHDKKTNTYKLNTSSLLVKKIKKGDIFYFYVFNLPMGKKGRVLIRGEVIEEVSLMRYNEVYLNSKNEDIIQGFKIEKLSTLGEYELVNNFFFTIDDINSKTDSLTDKKIINPRNWPNKIRNTLSIEAINILEKHFKKCSLNKDVNRLIKFFDRRCFFEGKIGTKDEHKSFIRRNGYKYYEIHHFIQQNQKNKNNSLHNILGVDSIIYGEKNQVTLCPNCHRKIHSGTVESIKEMLEILFYDNGIREILSSKCIKDAIGGDKEIKEWILKMYKC